MPIVDVEIVCTDDEQRALPGASALASALGRVFASAPAHTWVRLRVLDAANYAENDAPVPSPGPVFVTVLHARPPGDVTLDAEVIAVTQAVAAAVGRAPELVHVEYAPAAAGRQAFGGRLVR